MRTKFLFSTMLMAAAFTACTQEELVESNDNVMNEVVGAKLLGNGFAVNSGLESRIAIDAAGNARWSDGDKCAVAWVVKSGASASAEQQGVALGQVSTNVYANHMLVYGKNEGFTSRSNVFEGWHFAYTPYKPMARPQQVQLDVNPTLTLENLNYDQYLNMPMVSNAAFVSFADVNADGKVAKDFPLHWLANTIKPVLNVTKTFTDNENLNTIKINGITLNVGEGNNLFAQKYNVVPSALNEIAYDEDGAETTGIDKTYFGTDKAFQPVGGYTSSVTTVIDNSVLYNLGKAQSTVRMYLAPTQNASALELDDLSFRIDVNGGYFTVAYKAEQDAEGNDVKLTDTEKTNNQAIKDIYAMLKGGLQVTENVTINLAEANQATKKLNMTLSVENFKPDYTISDYDDWAQTVKIADALAEDGKTPEFVLEAGKEIVFPAGDMIIPTNGVKVSTTNPNVGASLAFDAETNWNEKIGTIGSGAGIKVKNNGILHVNSNLVATNIKVEEGGTIDAGVNASFNTHNHAGVYNAGYIYVKYGTNLVLQTSPGVVAYVVEGTETIAQIENLIRKPATNVHESGKYAQVNTFVINSGKEWNMLKTETNPGSEDVYRPTDDSKKTYTEGVLDNINFEINGGKVYAAANNIVSVKNVIMNGGSLEYVNIAGNLTVEGGEENIVTNETIGGNVIVKAETAITGTSFANDVTVLDNAELTLVDATIAGDLTNDGTVNIEGAATQIDNVVNNGTLNANTDVYVTTIAVNSGSHVVVGSENVIWYTIPQIEGGYIQKGTTTGQVLYYGAAAFINAIENAQAGETIVLQKNMDLPQAIETTNDVTIDLNGKAITGSILAKADLTVKNGEIVNADPKVSGIEIKSGKLTLEEVEVASARHALRIEAEDNAQIEAVIKSGIYQTTGNPKTTTHALNVSGNAKVTIYGGIFVGAKDTVSDSGSAVNVQKGSEVVIEGGNFSGGKNKTLQSKGTLIVKGGTFDQDPTEWVAAGYVAVQNGNTWIVSKN